MQAAVGAKQGPGGTGEPKERSVLENVPPWGPASSRPLWEWGAGIPFQTSVPRARTRSFVPCASDNHLLSDLELPGQPGPAEEQ